MYQDGVCRVTPRTFSKCIEFTDISYQLAQADTKTAIFENLCDLYNYLDASIHVQFSFINRKIDPKQYAKSFEIRAQGDDFDDIRSEYSDIFKQQIRRSFCLSQPGNFKEQGTSWIGKSPTVSSNRKRLTGKTSAQEFKVGDVAWIGFSDIFTELLSFGIEQGFIALIGFFIDFAVSYTGKSSGTGEPFPEPANTGEQVNISYGFLYHAPYLV